MSVSGVTEIRALTLRFPAAVVLGLTVAVATAVHAVLALRISAPWIVPDELIYSELAKSIGDGGLPAVRGEVSFAYGIGYPALLAPVWAVFDDVTTAYAVAKVLNALILGLTAVPAYFLARRFVSGAPALLVAALSVAVPSMVYAGTLLTEVALYPAFVLALLAMTVAIERPTLATQAGAVGAIALASAIKMLAAVLVLAYVLAVVLYRWLERPEETRSREWLKAYAPTWIVLTGALVVAATVATVSDRSPLDALGAYSVVLGNIDPLSTPWWALLHLGELDLYLAVIPFAATLLVLSQGQRRRAVRPLRLFVALAAPVIVGVIVVVAVYASKAHAGAIGYASSDARLHERSTFVLAPLFLIGLMLALTHSTVSKRRLVLAAVVAASLPALIPLERFSDNAAFQALALVPWIEERDLVMWPVGCVVMTAALTLLYVARARTGLIVVSVAAVFVTTTLTAYEKMEWSSDWTRDRAWGSHANWIDRAVGDATVSVLWAESPGGRFVEQAPRHRVVWLGELFNRSVSTVFELGAPMPYHLPTTRVRLDDGKVVLDDGRPVVLDGLVLAPCHVLVAGTPIARDPTTEAAIVRVSGNLHAAVHEPGSCPAEGAS